MIRFQRFTAVRIFRVCCDPAHEPILPIMQMGDAGDESRDGDQMGAKSDLRLPRAIERDGHCRRAKPGAPISQDPRSATVALVTRVGRASGRGNQSSAGEQAVEAVALTHELVEALTATGIYLETATRILEVETRPPGDTLGQVLEKSLTQFSRAVEAVRRLRATICP
jgi:hypothetical protein